MNSLPPVTLEQVLRELRQLRAETQGRGDLPTMTVRDAGQVLGCKRTRVFALIHQGKLVKVPRQGRQTMVTRTSVMALLEHVPEPVAVPRKPSKKTKDDPAQLEAAVRALVRNRRTRGASTGSDPSDAPASGAA